MHLCSILIIVQRDATQSSIFIILQVHSTCFGCQQHPSSGVHKTVTTASDTGAATSLQRGHLTTPEGGSCTPARVCDLETSQMRRPWPTFGRSATGNNKYLHSVPRHVAFKVSIIHMSYVCTTKYDIVIKTWLCHLK